MKGADVLAVIHRQKANKAKLRLFPLASRKPRKSLKKADVDAAINDKLDELDREFRRLAIEFPKFSLAYDTARVVVKNARSKA